MEYHIRQVTSMHEVHGIINVQRQAWEMDDIGIVPSFETKAVASFGTVLVAVTPDEEIIGFIYAMPMFYQEKAEVKHAHYSHMMAVLPEYQGQGIGLAMKRHHRKLALESVFDIQKISWTVDPLLPNNAYLNFFKLGCICNTYFVNYYGAPDSDGVGIYAGVDTDRFQVDWMIRSQKVEEHLLGTIPTLKTDDLRSRRIINQVVEEKWMNDIPNDLPTNFLVEVPSDYQKIRREQVELAREWRVKFRTICLRAFSIGYFTTNYYTIQDEGNRRNFYEFAKITH